MSIGRRVNIYIYILQPKYLSERVPIMCTYIHIYIIIYICIYIYIHIYIYHYNKIEIYSFSVS